MLLDHAGVELEGAEAVVIGRSNLFGKPMAQLLLERSATVTISQPLASSASRMVSLEENLPVPRRSRDENERPAMMSG